MKLDQQHSQLTRLKDLGGDFETNHKQNSTTNTTYNTATCYLQGPSAPVDDSYKDNNTPSRGLN